jgi:hypothetical protein
MSRATSPSPVAPPPSLPIITVALCASAKKHQQSFDALREAGERHNARLRCEFDRYVLSSSAATEHVVRYDPNREVGANPTASQGSGTCITSSAAVPAKPKSRGASSRPTTGEAECSTSRSGSGRSPCLARHPAPNYLFRFVNLNYDPRHHCMVLCTDNAVKGEQPPRVPRAEDEQEEGTDTATSTSEAAAAEAELLAEEVDVVLHKVATFGTPSAIRALERWCRVVQKQRSRRRQTPLIVVDPLDKVQLLMTRSMLYKLLDNTSANGRPVALIPRTHMWDRPGGHRRIAAASSAGAPSSMNSGAGGAAAGHDVVATPLGIHSFANLEDENSRDTRANGTAQARWWIAKPDEGTGPAFTHYLVMWCTRDQDVRVPPAVQTALPKEANRFILQELYVYALPVVIKVYCIAPHVYIKVNPTVNLLSHLWEQTRGSTLVDVPVMMDSQDRAFFSAVASLSATTLRPNLPQVTSGADYRVSTSERSTIPPPAAASSSFQAAKGSESPVALSQEALQSMDAAAVPWESMIAPEELWDAFLAPGTAAYIAVSKLAQEMSGFGGIGLSIYGFDIVLVPQHLAHMYQRKLSRGIGHTEGATVKYEVATPVSCASAPAPAAAAASSGAIPSVPLPFKASDMFDLATGAPTPLLLDSVPVVIDVNYFPGYKGVAEASQHTMELIAAKMARARDGASPPGHRPDDAAGSRDKKHQCDSM